ncbi:MAG: translocation/assembly module TamB, partial [Cyclobacteriaceae bacterium]|nr:translocation/assembly module TamB [Cyclobacteriaceae bacterium]
LEAGIKQKTQENIANLRSSIDFLEDTTQIRINEYRLTAIDKEWTLNPNNQILFYGDVIQIDNIKIEHENQSILGSGIISKSSTDSLKIEVKQFDLDNVSPLFQQDYSGDVNGEIYLTGLTDQTLINGSFELNQLFIDEFMVGDILVRTDWSTEEQRLELFFDAFRDQEKFLTVNGFFYPFRRDDQLDFNAQFFDTQLNIIEPFTGGLFSEIQGTLLGEASLKGTFSKPVVKGSGQFNDTSLKVDYLNTVYEAFGRISFDERLIDFNDIKLEDSKGSIANLSGGIRHRNFGNFTMDLSADIQNFMVLNTPLEPNSLYYGTVNASGNISFTGPFSNLSIDAQAKTNRNTRLYIPLGGFSSTRQQDYVTFYSARDQIFGNEEVEETKEEDRRVAVTGLSMNFDLEVTEEAYCEIIYDIKSGDIIRGRGNGNISLQIGSDGEFNMYGDYEISEGAYNFTLYNVINKEFTVEPKSRISWYGDPYDGTVDIKAYYRQLASLAPLFPMEDSAIVNRPEIRRRYPSRVNLNLTGPLMKPDVAFDIEIRDYPDNIIVEGLGSYSLRANVNAFENRIATDEQELKRQVFSLIIIGRFSPQDAFMTGQGGVGNSVSELLSNQLSYWLTQVDENLEIDFDLAGMDQEAFNTFQMRLSYSFLDGRLRITRDGGFTNVQSQTDVYSIAGEWTVEYLLTTDGRFRAKVYNRNNFNAFDPALQNTTNAMAGFSVQYTEGFSNFKELLDSWRGKSRKENRSGFWTEEEENEAIEKEKESQKEEKEKNQSEEAISREEEEEENTD